MAVREPGARVGMALFLSTFVNRVDKKGRVSVPATFRAALAAEKFGGVIVFPHLSLPAIEGLGMQQMEKLSAGIDSFNPFSDEHDAFALSILADSYQLPFDSEGRVVLPEALLAHAKIRDRAAFAGRGSTFQIWEPAAFRANQDEARRRAKTERKTLTLGGAGNGS